MTKKVKSNDAEKWDGLIQAVKDAKQPILAAILAKGKLKTISDTQIDFELYGSAFNLKSASRKMSVLSEIIKIYFGKKLKFQIIDCTNIDKPEGKKATSAQAKQPPVKETKYKTYSEKLRSPKWQKKRLKILERDSWTCRRCGETEVTLNVHHLVYKKNNDPWEYSNNDLMTLCNDCHEEEYINSWSEKENKKLIIELNKKGVLKSDIVDLLTNALDSLKKTPLENRVSFQGMSLEIGTLIKN